jgi:hypothetical protein
MEGVYELGTNLVLYIDAALSTAGTIDGVYFRS